MEATAAGTLKMTLIIWFRLRTIKTVANRFERNLEGEDQHRHEKKVGKNTDAMKKKIKPSEKMRRPIWLPAEWPTFFFPARPVVMSL